MAGQSSSSQPDKPPRRGSLQQRVLQYRHDLQEIQQQLLTENDLRRLTKDETNVEEIKNQLTEMLVYAKRLVEKSSANKYFIGINTFCTDIDDAITQVDVTLDALDELKSKFNADTRTQAYQALKKCRALLEDALLQMREIEGQ
jgi:hypothetical protein